MPPRRMPGGRAMWRVRRFATFEIRIPFTQPLPSTPGSTKYSFRIRTRGVSGYSTGWTIPRPMPTVLNRSG